MNLDANARPQIRKRRGAGGWILACVVAGAIANGAPAGDPAPITEAPEILRLDRDVAARGLPVDLTGVVTYVSQVRHQDLAWWDVFVHDGHANVYFNTEIEAQPARLGDRVRVRGVTGQGAFAPIIRSPAIEVLGRGELPAPIHVTPSDLFNARHSGDWVEMDSTVRMAEAGDGYLVLEIGDGAQHLNALIPFEGERPPDGAIGARVRLRGVVGQTLNQRGQVIDELLLVPRMDQVEWLEPGPGDDQVFSHTNIAQVGKWDPDAPDHDYVSVRGIVSHFNFLGHVYVQDDTGGIRVNPLQRKIRLSPGQRVEVIGIPEVVGEHLQLGSATILYESMGKPPEPLKTTVKSILEEDLHGLRVSVEGTVLRSARLRNGVIVSITNRGIPFEAYLFTTEVDEALARLEPRSRVRVTGIAEVDFDSRPESRLLIRMQKPEDIEVLQNAPWWTPQRLLIAIFLVLSLALLAAITLIVLRRKIAHQTDELRRRLQRETQLERRLEQIFANLPDPLIITGLQGVIHEANAAAETYFAVASGQLGGRRVHEFIAPKDHNDFRAFFRELQTGNDSQKELENRTLEGETRISEWNARRVGLEQEPRVLIQIRDLSERRMLETQLMHSQKMETIGRLAAGVAHDFNNLLMVLRGGIDMLFASKGMPAEDDQIVRMMDKSVRQGANLTKQLLTFSRRQPIEIKSVDLNQILEGAGSLLERIKSKTIDVKVQPGRQPLRCEADPNLIEQVVLNLAVNAFDAMPEGGKLLIGAAPIKIDADSAARRPGARAGAFAEITVRDTGLGMSREVSERIFEPFFSTKEVGKGTGLGLAIVYGIVEEHGGWIEVGSQAGHGSEFRVYLPQDPATAAGAGEVNGLSVQFHRLGAE